MQFHLEPEASEIDIYAQSRFCIAEGLKNQESVKRTSKLNRLNISDSLNLVKREKQHHPLTKDIRHVHTDACASQSASMYSSTLQSDQTGMIDLNRRYSMPRQYRPLPPQEDENVYQQLSQHLKTRKLNRSKVQQGLGMDAFWTVRMQKAEEAVRQKKKARKNATGVLTVELSPNPIESAYMSIMAWAKLPQDTSNIIDNAGGSLPRAVFKNYIIARTTNERFSVRFLRTPTNYSEFFQFKSFTSFKDFTAFGDYLKGVGLRLSNLISFMLYDLNDDGYVCQGDVFRLFSGDLSKRLEPDLMRIGSFIKSEPVVDVDQLEERYKIQILILTDTLLTIKDYEMYFKKVQEPYMKAKNKKDTIFAKSFIVLDHREKVRSTRKEMEIKKTMYNQLIGEILGNSKNKDVLLRLDRFRLDFGTFASIFNEDKSQFFRYFCESVFGVNL